MAPRALIVAAAVASSTAAGVGVGYLTITLAEIAARCTSLWC